MEDNSSRDLILWFFLLLFLVSPLMPGRLLCPLIAIISLAFGLTGVFSPIYAALALLLENFHFQIAGDHLNRILSEISKAVGMFVYKQASAIASNVFTFIVNFSLCC